MTDKQQEFIARFQKNFCNISKTMEHFKLTRTSYLKWLEDQEFSEALWSSRESMRDAVEAQIYRQIIKNADTSVLNKFGLSILRERDYYEKKEVEFNAENNNYITLFDGEGDEFDIDTKPKNRGH